MIDQPSSQIPPNEQPPPGVPGVLPLHPEQLTWAALLGKWVDFAQGSLALPNDDAGRKLKASVPDLIMLQAVWFALGELEELSEAERALGLDRAGVLIEKHTEALRDTWSEPGMPAQIRELIGEAETRLNEWRAKPGAMGQSSDP